VCPVFRVCLRVDILTLDHLGSSLNYTQPVTTIPPRPAPVIDLTLSRSATPELRNINPGNGPSPMTEWDVQGPWPSIHKPQPTADMGQNGGRKASFSGEKPSNGDQEKRIMSTPPNGTANGDVGPLSRSQPPLTEPSSPVQIKNGMYGSSIDLFSME
jgi:hypothetical protein